MKVKQEFVETDPSCDAGACFTHLFRANGEKMFGRQWQEQMRAAELLHWTDRSKNFQIFYSIPYDHELFRQAVRHYVDVERVRDVYVLVFNRRKRTQPTFQRVDLRRIPRQEPKERRTKGSSVRGKPRR